MASIEHEGLVEIVRQHPLVAVEILHHVGTFAIPDPVTADLGSEDMSAVSPRSNRRAKGKKPRPDKYTADSVVVVSDPATGERLLSVIIEPQGKFDEGKDVSWPVYTTVALKANRCPRSVLIGACWDLAEADKCRTLVAIGHPGFVFAPIIVDGRTPFDLASGSPYLTLFSAVLGGIDMTDEQGSRRVVEAIANTGADQADRRSLSNIILGVASDAARERLEGLMTVSYRDPFVEGWVNQGKAEGKSEGKTEGEIQARAADILKALNTRGVETTKAQRTMITSSTDLDELSTWFERALTATTASEVFRG